MFKYARNLTLEETREEFLKKLKQAGIERILGCIQCGVCSASCPSGRVTAFNTRQLIRKTSLGQKEILLSKDLWLCTTCSTCVERCPKKIEIIPIIIALRNMAVESGYMIPRHRDISHILIRHGHAVPINEENRKKRKSLGLDGVPPTVHSFKQALKELHTLFRKSGFDKKVELDL